jgi:holo-[acyl-carrier protein] synthase
MQIIGHGIDMVDLSGIRRLLDEGLLSHWAPTLNSNEIADSGQSTETGYVEKLAGQFALMQAICKACGGSPDQEIDWSEIHVKKQATGQPCVELSGRLACHCQSLGITDWVVSIAHTPTCAVGTAIAMA